MAKSNQAETATPHSSIYTSEGRRILQISIVSTAILLPSLLTSYLQPVVTFFVPVLLLGIFLIRRSRPKSIPTWVVFNLFSTYIIIYAAYSFGSTFQVTTLALFLVGMIIYDTVGVKGGQMQSMAGKMIHYGVPLFVMVPHNPAFSFTTFRDIVGEDGLEGLHESQHGVSMLGVGDGFLPGALAVAAGNIGTQFGTSQIAVSIPQATTAIGGIIGLAILMWAELPRAIAALIVSVPGALLGLVIGIMLDPVALEALSIPFTNYL